VKLEEITQNRIRVDYVHNYNLINKLVETVLDFTDLIVQ